MKSWTFIRLFILSLFLGACSRNPLGEDLKQPILNLDIILQQSCTNTLNQDAPYTCQITTTEPISGLTWSMTQGARCDWATINATTGIITGTPNDNQVGTCQVSVRAEKGKASSNDLIVNIQVNNIAPTLTITNAANILEDAALTIIRSAASVQASEEGFGVYSLAGDAATSTPRCSDNATTLSVDPTTGAVSYAPALNYNGTCYIRIAFDDENSLANSVVTSQFSITVTPVNDAPVISPIAAQTTNEDTPLVLNFTVTDVDNALLCSSVTRTTSNTTLIPLANIVISGAVPNCVATITPAAGLNGTSNISLAITDGALSDTKNFVLTVVPVNDPPVMSTIANQTMNEDGTLAATFTITDVDNGLACNATNLTAVSSNAGLLPVANIVWSGVAPNCTATITPLMNQNGVSNLTFTVRDNGVPNLTDAQSFSLTVNAVNDAPLISSITNQFTNEDTPLAVNFTISDVDNALACSSANLTAVSTNAAVIPVANITFSGTAPNCTATFTPLPNQFGITNIDLIASDGSLSATSSFNVTVASVNDAPILSAITNQTTTEGVGVVVNFTITDVDNPLNCTTSMSRTSSNTTLLPVGNIVFGGAAPNCTATITPVALQSGVSNLSFTVTDGTLTDVKNFTFTVTAVNDPPVLSTILNQTTNEDTPVIVNFTISDPDDTLDCSISMSRTSSNTTLLPAGNIVFGGAAPNCTATITPAADQFGTSNISFTVTDGSLTDVKNFTLTVNAVNDAPVMSNISNQTTSEDTGLVLNFTINDVDNVLDCSTSVAKTSSNTTLLPLANIVYGGTAPNCTATITPTLNQSGVSNLSFTVSDGTLTDVKNFTLTVNAVNDAPVLSSIANQTTIEGVPVVINFTVNDVDSLLVCSTLNIAATSSNGGLLPVANIVYSGTAPNCTATLTPVTNMSGISNINLVLSDNGTPNLQDSKAFTLTVTGVDDPPILSAIANQTTAEDTALIVNFTINDVDSALDCSTSMSKTTSNGTLLPAANIVFGGTAPNCTATLTPAPNQFGTSNLSFTVSDGNTTDVKNFTLTVTAVNDAPILSAIVNQTTPQDTALVINFTINDVDNVLDCSTSMAKTSSNTTLLPLANIVFSGTAPNCTATLTPVFTQNGVSNVSFTVTDGTLTDIKNFTFTVTAVNYPPVLSAIANQTTNEDVPLVVNFTITDLNDTLDCSTSMAKTSSNTTLLPVANIVFGGAAPNCTATITPFLNQSGTSNLSFTVTDGTLTDVKSFTLTVNAVNDAPILSAIANQTTAEDSALVVNFTINDVDSVLDCSTSMAKTSSNTTLLPVANIVFGGTAPNCTATLTPALNQNGVSNLSFTVSDGTLTDVKNFMFTVTAVDDPPVLSTITNQTTPEDTPLIVNFTINDPDSVLDCSTSMAKTSSNTTLLPVANIVFAGTAPNCTATLSPALNQFGTSNLSFTVTDGTSNDVKNFTFTVTAVNDAPVLSNITNQTTVEDTALVVNFTINDVDNVLDCSTSMAKTSSNTTLLPVANIVFAGTAPNCTATITPLADQSGVSNLSFTVSDGTLTDVKNFTFTVTAVNDPPVLSAISNQTTSEDSVLSVNFTINDVDSVLDCATSMSKTSSNTTLLPVANIVFSGAAPNCTATITPAPDQYGTSNLSFTVTDGTSNDVKNFTLSVTAVNDAPVLSAITNQTTLEDTAVVVNFTVNDVDSILLCSTLNLAITSSNTGLLPVASVVYGGTAPNCTATLTPAANQNGLTNLTLTLNDNGTPNLQDSKSFSLTVTAVNDPPIISAIANQTTPEDTALSVNFTITDVDDTLDCSTSMTSSSSNTAIVPALNIIFSGTAPNCSALITPVANQNGVLNLTFRVSDGTNFQDRTFQLTVTAVDDPPVISAVTNQTTSEETAIVINFTINDVDSTLDCSTSMSKTSSNTALIPVANIVYGGAAPNCTATVTPAANQSGVSTLGFVVTDGTTPVTRNFTLTVVAVNDPPVLSTIADQTINEDGSVVVNFTINDPDDTLNCSTSMSKTSSNTTLLPLPNIVFAGTAPNCTATITPAVNQSGISNISFTVSDGSLTDVKNFVLTVNPINDPPVLSTLYDDFMTEDTPYVLNFTITDPDNILDCTTSMSVTTSDPAVIALGGIVFGGTAPNCTATITPVQDANGFSDLVFTVTDGTSQDSKPINLTISAVNDPPTIVAIAPQTTPEDTPLVLNFTVNDVDSPITCAGSVLVTSSNNTMLPAPASFVFSGTVPTCTATITPAANRFGTSNVNFFVTDGFAIANRNFSVTVTSVNDAPVISAISAQSTNAATPLAVSFTISDVETTLTCSGTYLSMTSSNTTLVPTGNVVWSGSAPNCVGTITSVGSGGGTINLSFVASDGTTTTPSPFVLTVNSTNSAPTITSISAQTVYEGRPETVGFTLADSDGPLSCSGTNLSATSSNGTMLPTGNIVFGGSYPNCTATLSLAAGQNGSSNVAITVTDTIATNSASFVVTGHKVNSVALSPLMPIIPRNSNVSFTLTATYSDSSTRNITTSSTWTTSNTGISSFPSPGVLNNTYAGGATVNTTITGTYGAFSANTTATINPTTITSLFVTPTSATMNVGNKLQVRCYGITSDGGVIELTQSCSWATANATIATVNNSIDKGEVTAVNLGSATNITATYSALTASSAITVDVTPPTQSDDGTGLTARYYTGTNFNTLTNTRIDSIVNFNWAAGNNPAGSADSFSVRWTGFIVVPTSGSYTFFTQSDDGVNLWVNGSNVVSNWTPHGSTENSGAITLTAGTKYAITLEFFEQGGDALIQLRYQGPSVSKQIIPQSQLYP